MQVAPACCGQAPLRVFKEQELSNTMWALSSLGRMDTHIPALFTREAVARGLHAFSAQGVANCMWACACLGHRDDTFMHVRPLGREAQILKHGGWLHGRMRVPGLLRLPSCMCVLDPMVYGLGVMTLNRAWLAERRLRCGRGADDCASFLNL